MALRALLCWAALSGLAAGCVRRPPETADWEADARAAAAGPLACGVKDLELQTIDRTFFELQGRFTTRRMILAVSGCDKETILVWTPEAGWLAHPPQQLKPRAPVKTGPVLDGKVIKP